MHLLASYKSGALRALPQILPAGLYEAAARRGGPLRQMTGSRPSSDVMSGSAIPRQFSGAGPQRTSSPMNRSSFGTTPSSVGPTAIDWAISPQDKAQFDQFFATVDTDHRGFITGDQAVGFFSNSRLPEDILAQIWDLADINSEGQLNTDEFAVAMFLIRQQRAKKDGRGVLPQTLPPNLIPPSMRRQPIAPQQPTAPAFDNAANITAPKSASEDLFGLDVLASPSPQVPQSTGDSTNYMQHSPRSPPLQQPSSSQPQSSVFKPFVPSSSFGQTIMTPQATGNSSNATASPPTRAQQKQPAAMDDLLGDNDPEISNRLTKETSELANLSNQVSNLTGQMQDVKSKRTSTQQDLSQVNSQKRDFEARLTHLRSAYEQEVREVKVLEERLTSSKSETKKLQQDMAMIEGTHQDLSNQHQQVAGALDMDRKENANLKERISQINTEIGGLKPQLEKLRSDARQQKGLVAINRKQLATIEGERDKLKGELDSASKELSDATREVDESERSLHAVSQVQSPTIVSSPGGSTTSMNPFFRRPPTAASEKSALQSPFATQAVVSPNHTAFDSFFGPSDTSSAQSSGPPPMSSRNESSIHSRGISQPPVPSVQSVRSSEELDVPTPSDSPATSTYHDSSEVVAPPPPPQSRQITSSFLPLRNNVQRSGSASSSVRVTPPTSRFGESSGVDTPVNRQMRSSDASKDDSPTLQHDSTDEPTRGGADSSFSPSQRAPSTSSFINQRQQPSFESSPQSQLYQSFGQPRGSLPGSFPGDEATPSVEAKSFAYEPSRSTSKSPDVHPNDQLSSHNDSFPRTSENVRSPKEDFDAAFAGFGDTDKATVRSNGDAIDSPQDGEEKARAPREFPPIHEFGADEESDSDSDVGFDDNFTAASPRRKRAVSNQKESQQSYTPGVGGSDMDNLAPSRPALTTTASDASQLPTPGAQKSPPTYDQTVSSPFGGLDGRKGSNQFPAEYTGLLPSREDPTSPPPSQDGPLNPITSPMNGTKGSNLFGHNDAAERATAGNTISPSQMPMAPGATAAPYAYNKDPPHVEQPQAQSAPKTDLDDFDDEFGDLSEAKEADEKGGDDFATSHKDPFDEFNPVFDSPAPSKPINQSPSSTLPTDNGFHDFESSVTGSAQGPNSRQPPLQSPANTSHDWDSIFSGLDTSHTNDVQPTLPSKVNFNPSGKEAPQLSGLTGAASSSSGTTLGTAKPSLNRGISMGNEHDDPILKRLTGMGYPRDESLDALEKFDYNIDKVRFPPPFLLLPVYALFLV